MLASGRNKTPLTTAQRERVREHVSALLPDVEVEFDDAHDAYTHMKETYDADSNRVGKLVVAADFLPGNADPMPNSMVDDLATAAHELMHIVRWRYQHELDYKKHRDLEEAFTSLQAAVFFCKDLREQQLVMLANDAMQRLLSHTDRYLGLCDGNHD